MFWAWAANCDPTVAMPTLGFSEEDKKGMLQPYDDALVVTIWIEGYDVRRVRIDQGSGQRLCTWTYLRG